MGNGVQGISVEITKDVQAENPTTYSSQLVNEGKANPTPARSTQKGWATEFHTSCSQPVQGVAASFRK